MRIEAARTGYLYVVDQEQYADGSKGEPYLIFPTARNRGGDNSVKAGRVIEIPAQDDSPPYFTLKRIRVDHVGESVIVLVTPTPIQTLTITDKAQRLSAETLALWEKSWGGQTGATESKFKKICMSFGQDIGNCLALRESASSKSPDHLVFSTFQ